jgi:hypothetical protein
VRVFEKGVLKIFGSKREEDGSWRKLHNDGIHILYSSSNIFRVINCRRMSWAVYVGSIGRGDVFSAFWLGGPKARDHWEDLEVGGRIILKWTLGRCVDEVIWIQLAQDRVQ